jgi:hypothetical protein
MSYRDAEELDVLHLLQDDVSDGLVVIVIVICIRELSTIDKKDRQTAAPCHAQTSFQI